MSSSSMENAGGWLARRSGGRSNAFKLAVLLAAPVVSLLALELGLRVRAHVRNNLTLEAAFTVPGPPDPKGRTRFIDIIQPNANDRIIYELRPNLRTTFKDRPFTTNRHGFRGPEVAVEAGEGTITILGIGASIMVGHGVGDGEEYPRVLERLLNEAHPAKRWRVIDTAVPSYNVVMKVETLKEKGLRFAPDLVLLGIASNNLGLPTYIRVEEEPLDLGRSFLLELVDDLWGRRAEQTALLGRVTRSELSWGAAILDDPEKVPPRFRDLVGWGPFHEALDELARLRDAHGFEVVVFANLDVDLVTGMLAAAREREFGVVDLTDELVEWLRERGAGGIDAERYLRSELVVSRGNSHPSAFQHEMAARRILRDWERDGTIARLLARD